jgi:hypothetical protein
VINEIKARIKPSAQVLLLPLALLRRKADSHWLTSSKIVYFAVFVHIALARTAF